MKNNYLSVIILCLSIGLYGCQTTPDENRVPEWETNLFGPIAKTDLTIQNAFQFQTLAADTGFKLNTLPGLIADTFPVWPGLTLPTIGPLDASISTGFENLTLTSGIFRVTFINKLPISFKPGVILILKSGNIEIIRHTTTTRIPANGGSYTFDADVSNKPISSKIAMVIEQLGTEAVSGPVTFTADQEIRLAARLDNVNFKSVTINSDNFFMVADTAAFSVRGAEVNTLVVSEGGKVKLFVTNHMPVTFRVQGYLLDSTQNTTLDSLLSGDTRMPGAAIDANGRVTTPTEKVFEVPLTPKLTEALNNARFLRGYAAFATTDNRQVIITDTDFIKLQMIGDFKLKIN
jgi:hypothetical protein